MKLTARARPSRASVRAGYTVPFCTCMRASRQISSTMFFVMLSSTRHERPANVVYTCAQQQTRALCRATCAPSSPSRKALECATITELPQANRTFAVVTALQTTYDGHSPPCPSPIETIGDTSLHGCSCCKLSVASSCAGVAVLHTLPTTTSPATCRVCTPPSETRLLESGPAAARGLPR